MSAAKTQPRGGLPKRKKGNLTIRCETSHDGVRVERWYDEDGNVDYEQAAVIELQQLGPNGAVFFDLAKLLLAEEHFAFAKEKLKAAGGKYSPRKLPARGGLWRLPATAGLSLADELAAEGYVIDRVGALDADREIHDALCAKFLGVEQYRHSIGDAVVSLTPSGFVVELYSGERYPCSLGEAVMLHEADWRFSDDALACIARLRSAAACRTEGQGQ